MEPKTESVQTLTQVNAVQSGISHQKAHYDKLGLFNSPDTLPRYPIKLQPDIVETPSTTRIPGEAAYFKGLNAYHHAYYLQAKDYFEEAATYAYPAAYLWLGRLYHYSGYIGSKNETMSEQWYDQVRTTIQWFQAQAQMGRADAYYNLGWCYHFGIGVEKNKVEAVHYYHLAVDQGYVLAQVNLGLCYEFGIGIEKNEFEAVRYYRLAAIQGNATAQCNLGVCYATGRGIEQNGTQAMRYYHLAATQGDADAQFNLGVCYDVGNGIKKNEAKAVRYYRLAANQGHVRAQMQLEKLLQHYTHLKLAPHAYTPNFFLAAPQDISIEELNIKGKANNISFVPKNENCCVM